MILKKLLVYMNADWRKGSDVQNVACWLCPGPLTFPLNTVWLWLTWRRTLRPDQMWQCSDRSSSICLVRAVWFYRGWHIPVCLSLPLFCSLNRWQAEGVGFDLVKKELTQMKGSDLQLTGLNLWPTFRCSRSMLVKPRSLQVFITSIQTAAGFSN